MQDEDKREIKMTSRFLDGAAESLMMLYQDWRDRQSNRFRVATRVKSIILLRLRNVGKEFKMQCDKCH